MTLVQIVEDLDPGMAYRFIKIGGRYLTPTISIIIPTFQRHARLVASLNSLGECHDAAKAEVIVVDQSRDTLPPKESRCNLLPFDLIWLLLEGRNVSAARNVGAMAASASILLFIDDDIELDKSYLIKLKELMEADSVDVIGGNYVESFCDKEQSGLTLEPVEWLPAGNLSLRRNEFIAIGGFDENIFRYNEDAELSHRLRRSGLRLARHRGLSAIHHHQAQGGTWYRRSVWDTSRSVLRNDLYFIRAIGGGIDRLLLTAVGDIKASLRGNGRITGGSFCSRLLSSCLALPGAFVYAFRSPILLRGCSDADREQHCFEVLRPARRNGVDP